MHDIVFSKNSRKSLKKMARSGQFDVKTVSKVINMIAKSEILEIKYQNHRLQGKYKDCFECHIKSDLLLIYKIDEENKILLVVDIGTHSELFE